MSKANMEITQHFKENYVRANEWLKANAPDYVRECVEELGHHAIRNAQAALLVSNQATEANDRCIYWINQYTSLLDDCVRTKWYYWVMPPIAFFYWLLISRPYFKNRQNDPKIT